MSLSDYAFPIPPKPWPRPDPHLHPIRTNVHYLPTDPAAMRRELFPESYRLSKALDDQILIQKLERESITREALKRGLDKELIWEGGLMTIPSIVDRIQIATGILPKLPRYTPKLKEEVLPPGKYPVRMILSALGEQLGMVWRTTEQGTVEFKPIPRSTLRETAGPRTIKMSSLSPLMQKYLQGLSATERNIFTQFLRNEQGAPKTEPQDCESESE